MGVVCMCTLCRMFVRVGVYIIGERVILKCGTTQNEECLQHEIEILSKYITSNNNNNSSVGDDVILRPLKFITSVKLFRMSLYPLYLCAHACVCVIVCACVRACVRYLYVFVFACICDLCIPIAVSLCFIVSHCLLVALFLFVHCVPLNHSYLYNSTQCIVTDTSFYIHFFR